MGLRSRRGRRRQDRPPAAIDMTSLIDLTFLLLVTFIITLPAMEMGISLVLPKAKAEALPPKESTTHTVSVDEKGAIFLDGKETSLEELEKSLAALVAEDPDVPVLVRGDENRPYGEIAKVVAAAHRRGIHRMSIVTQQD
jgi:biopolymer transport protein ExbD